MLKLSPSDVFFSQDSISNRFGNYTRHHNKTIGETLDDIISGKCTITDLPTINVIKKGQVWVTADNRRLWVFKKLQQLGKCHTIDAIETYSIKPTKGCILSRTRVRGYEGGTLWRSLECKQQNPDSRTSVSPFLSQREASLDSMSLSDQTQKWSSRLSSVSGSKCAGYHGVVRRTGNSGLATKSFKDQTTVMASKFSTSVFEKPAACEVFESKFKPTETSSCKVAWPEGSSGEAVRQPYVQETVNTVRLNPLDVGFAGGVRYFESFDGNKMGELIDKLLQTLPQRMVYFNLKVFKHQGKYFSEERVRLWIIQSLNRFSDKLMIEGNVIPTPTNISTMKFRDSLNSIVRVGGEKWKNIATLNCLPTMKKNRLNLADIMYSTKTILDTYNGQSIVKKLIKVFRFQRKTFLLLFGLRIFLFFFFFFFFPRRKH